MQKRIFLKIGNVYMWVIALTLLPANSIAQKYQTLGTGSCGLGQANCHARENDTWYKNDPHKVTVDAFFEDPESYEKIAELAGVGAANMLKGNQNCMECHGTVISGKETREVEEGVSCESCHGPGSGYKDPHSEGDPNLGVNRPGYIKALQLGLVKLKDADIQVETCVRCHYITDSKLISAGHPTGERFNYVGGIKKVSKHWRRSKVENYSAKGPFDNAKSRKGPVAKIAKVEPPQRAFEPAPTPKPATPQTDTPSAPPAKTPVATPAKTPAAPQPAPQPVVARPTRAPVPPPPRPVDPVAPPAENVGPVDLPPFPAVSDSTPLPELLLILKKRLELLYQKTGGY
jgi:hypothetical protein